MTPSCPFVHMLLEIMQCLSTSARSDHREAFPQRPGRALESASFVRSKRCPLKTVLRTLTGWQPMMPCVRVTQTKPIPGAEDPERLAAFTHPPYELFYLHHPIEDLGVPESSEALHGLIDDLIARVAQGARGAGPARDMLGRAHQQGLYVSIGPARCAKARGVWSLLSRSSCRP